MSTLTHSDIFTKSHQVARILGYTEFPKILTNIWKIYYNYKDGVPNKNYTLALQDGINSSFKVSRELARVGFKMEDTPSGCFVEGTNFEIKNFKTGKVRLTSSSIKLLEFKLFRSTILKNNKFKERSFVASQIAINNEGYKLLNNGDIETSSGFIIYSFKGIKDVYKFPVSKQIEYDKHCLNQSKLNKGKPAEIELQAALISFWNTLARSTDLDISVDYEIGVHSGKKILDLTESRYDLVTQVGDKYELIELKRGIIDISTVNYKIGIMKMGLQNYCSYTQSNDSTLVFIGSSIDENLNNIKGIFDKDKINLRSFPEYIVQLNLLMEKANLNEFDKEIAKLYLNQLKTLVNI